MITINEISYRIAGRLLLDKASLSIGSGHRVGLVGPNGVGKSTLFKLINGELELDSGEISMISGTKIGMVRQDLPDDDTSLIDVVLAADKERSMLLQEAETATDSDRIVEIYTRLGDIDAYEAPARAAIILDGLGFNQEAQQRAIKDFSGGWRMRVALAAALFSNPDLLMLDEPTNHLDFEAIIWLENYLINYPGTLIIISHDRDILNKTVTHIAHIDQRKLISYTGNYDQFEILRAQKMMGQQALYEKQQAQKNKMMEFVNRFRAKATKAKQAQSRLKAIEKMDMVDAIIAERSISFNFPAPDELSPPIISLYDVDVGYEPGKPVLRKLDLRIDMEDRIALLGANGNGKSTLIKLLSGKLAAMKGELNKSSKLRVGYFAQHQAEEMDMESTPYLTLKSMMKEDPEPKVRGLLGRFGFDKQKADTTIKELSGGEKARLLFCLMSYNAPHIMLLDEPTNHLDMDARQALIQALNNYSGCVILVSHDPHLVEAVADQLWVVKNASCNPFDGDVDAYRKMVVSERRKERSEAKKSSSVKKEKAPDKKEVAKLEKQIEKLQVQKISLEEKMADNKVINAPDLLKELAREYDILQKELEIAEGKWIEYNE